MDDGCNWPKGYGMQIALGILVPAFAIAMLVIGRMNSIISELRNDMALLQANLMVVAALEDSVDTSIVELTPPSTHDLSTIVEECEVEVHKPCSSRQMLERETVF